MVTTNTDLYATDFYAWCLTTAQLVRTGQWEEIDPEALVEELEGLARTDKRKLESRLEVLVMHLLKWKYQPQGHLDSHSWYDTILDQRNQLARLLRDNPSLRRQVPALLPEVYDNARQRAIGEMGPAGPLQMPATHGPAERGRLDLRDLARRSLLPMACPWTDSQILDKDFWPEP
jgi:hypothetical protein